MTEIGDGYRNTVAEPLDSGGDVVDLVGSTGWSELLDAPRPGGRYAISGLIAAAHPLDRIAEAQAAFQTKPHIGKIVLTVADVT